jgi:hypothetical protein
MLDRPVSPMSPLGSWHGRPTLEAGRGSRGRLAFCTASLFDPLTLDPDTDPRLFRCRFSRCPTGGAGMCSHPHKCDATEDHIDAHQQPQRPGSGARKSREDDASEEKIDNPAD